MELGEADPAGRKPPGLRRRMLFVEAEPLRRARMPHDERWRAYEYLRTGMMPDDGTG
ncbi:hypothetical protein [Skermanella pratensis]|uniref:hypothetical protein n=1 Tax=Skermanella pratensis TaxID=2233999 RepID=UPI001788483F|nr:hypothetical protein [Skermanella pratensis]